MIRLFEFGKTRQGARMMDQEAQKAMIRLFKFGKLPQGIVSAPTINTSIGWLVWLGHPMGTSSLLAALIKLCRYGK